MKPRCVRLGREATCARPEQPKRRWTTAPARTQRLIDRLATALASNAGDTPSPSSSNAPSPSHAVGAAGANSLNAYAQSTVFVVDATGMVLSASGLDPTVFGDTCASFVGRNVFSCIDPDDMAMLARALSIAPTLPDIVIPHLIRFVNSAGQSLWVELAISARPGSQQEVNMEVGAPRMVTRLQSDTVDPTIISLAVADPEPAPYESASPNASEASTGASEVDGVPFLGFTLRQSFEGTILDVTKEVEMVLGYKPAELLGTSVTRLMQPNDVLLLKDLMIMLLTGQHQRCMGRLRMITHDGELVWVEMRVCVMPAAVPGGPSSLMCTVALLSFLQEFGSIVPVECIAKLPADVTAVREIAQAAYEKYDADRVEARLLDASLAYSSTAHTDEDGLESGTHLTGDMSAETYHRYIGIDAFVDSWMLGN